MRTALIPRVLMVVLGVAMLSLSACGEATTDGNGDVGQSEVQPEVFTAVVTNKAISFVKSLEAEPVIVEVDNQAKFETHPAFARLNVGVTPTQVTRQFAKDPEGVLKMVIIAGSTEAVSAGSTVQSVFEFVPGTYLVTDPEARGMKPAFFEVVEATGGPIAEPESDAALEVGDFYFKFPEGIASGDVTFEVSNAGEQSHEVIFTKGKKEYGFFLAPVPGGRAWQTVRLPTPGKYTAVCYFPDPRTGKPHVKLGMKTSFEVS
ncbi:MAG TPA: hypothetical protein VHJ82_09645 [Actinomycetota bacterium]|nr:hypothetical protein [Actinomycetota bacterium]